MNLTKKAMCIYSFGSASALPISNIREHINKIHSWMNNSTFEHLLFNKANSEKILMFGEFVDSLTELQKQYTR